MLPDKIRLAVELALLLFKLIVPVLLMVAPKPLKSKVAVVELMGVTLTPLSPCETIEDSDCHSSSDHCRSAAIVIGVIPRLK